MKMETNFIEFYTQFVVPEKNPYSPHGWFLGFNAPTALNTPV